MLRNYIILLSNDNSQYFAYECIYDGTSVENILKLIVIKIIFNVNIWPQISPASYFI